MIEIRKTIAKQALKLFRAGKEHAQVIKILKINEDYWRLI